MSSPPTPDSAPTSPDRWPALLLLGVAVFGPPSVAVLKFTQAVTQNPWLTVGLIVLYEVIVALVSIVSGVWQQLKDSWVKQIAATIDSAVQNALSRYYHHYRAYFCYEHRDLDLRGMSIQGEYTLDVEDVFVELRIDPKPAHEASPDLLRLPEKLRTQRQTIWDYLRAKPLQGQHLVILGAPGSGKTTLLRHLGLRLLHYRHLGSPQRLPRKLPVLLLLRDHGTAIKENPHYTLADAIRAHTGKWPQKMPPNWIERRLKRGHCLILLDGLDEVADPETRQDVVRWVREQMVAYGRNRFILTSRPFGYRSNSISGMNILEVQPFTWDQITQFVEHWYLTNEIKSATRDDPGVRMKAREGASDLLRRLRANAAIFALASNPLLLTMTATVHRYRGSLPGTRVTLYKEICEVLLGKRREVQGVKQDLRAEQRQLVLQALAYQMMEREQRDITEQQAQHIIAPALQEVNTTLTPYKFLQSIEHDCGLLVEREQGLYAFAHLTFQEYLTAVHIREQSLEHELTTRVELDWWHETIRLYCAQANASAIIAACLRKEPPWVPALTLALECLEEARSIQKEVKQRLDHTIKQGIESLDPERRRAISEALLAHRLRQMRPLNEQTQVDTSLMTCAEYQLFLDEQQAQGKHLQPDHWRQSIFPPGKGSAPILGIRYSDAQAFCSWLTERDPNAWHYRVPHIRELQRNAIASISNEEIGYWADEKGSPHIVWLKGKPPEAINVEINHARNYAHARANALALEQAIERAGKLLGNSKLDLDLDLVSDLNLALAHADTLVLDLDLDLTDDRNHKLVLEFESALNPAREFKDTRDHTLAFDRALARALALTLTFATDLERNHDRALALAHNLDRALTLYFILFLLQERISGKLPAYVGILLLREHRDKEEKI